MKETIKSIKEVFNIKTTHGESYSNYDGFEIVTDKRNIFLLIENGQSCCESWGTFETNGEDLTKFSGTELLSIDTVDTALDKKKYEEKFEYGLEGGDVMFVNLETSVGVLQIAVYNSHNGYYGHEVLFIKGDEVEATCL